MLLVLGSPDLTFGSTQEISETCVQVRKQQLVLDMEQQTDSKLGKEYIKAVYYTLLIELYGEYIM